MKKKISNGILYFTLICLSLIFLFPFFWALVRDYEEKSVNKILL